jgi:excisionase family DNA binding protein
MRAAAATMTTMNSGGSGAAKRDKMGRPSGRFFDNGPPGSTDMFSSAEAAELLGVSISTMRRLQRGRRVPFFKIGRCVRYRRSDLVAYMSKYRIEAVG